MDIDRPINDVPWELTNFPAEVICSLGGFIDLWSVGRLFCCGDRKLNKMLISSPGVLHISLRDVTTSTIWLPSIVSEMKNLKTIHLEPTPMHSICSLTLSCQSILQNLPSTLEDFSLLNISVPKHIFWNGEEMQAENSFANHSLELRYPNLTRLRYLPMSYGELNEHVALANASFLDALPTSLTDLQIQLSPDPQVQILGSWISRLPSLEVLTLLSRSRQSVQFDEAAIQNLPPRLKYLSLCSANGFTLLEQSQIDESAQEKANKGAKFILENLPRNLRHLEFMSEFQEQDLIGLSCWDSLETLSLSSATGFNALPPRLTSLTLDGATQTPVQALPSGLISLNWALWVPTPQDMTALPKTLTRLVCILSEPVLSLIPPSVTYLEFGSQRYEDWDPILSAKPWLHLLPKIGLRTFVQPQITTWIRSKELKKFYFKRLRNPNLHVEADMGVSDFDLLGGSSAPESSENILLSGLGGSGWTSLAHALVLDCPALADEILRFEPSLVLEIEDMAYFQSAIRLRSLNMLNWLEEKGKLCFYKEDYDMLFNSEGEDSCVVLAYRLNYLEIVEWLYNRGFVMGLIDEGMDPYQLAAQNDSPQAMTWVRKRVGYLESKKASCIELTGTDLLEATALLGGHEASARTWSAIYNASQCWHWLNSNPLETLTEGLEPGLLPSDIDFPLIIGDMLENGNYLGLTLMEDMMHAHDEAVEGYWEKQSQKARPANASNLPSSIAEMTLLAIANATLQSVRTVQTVLEWLEARQFLSASFVNYKGASLLDACFSFIDDYQEGERGGYAEFKGDRRDGDDSGETIILRLLTWFHEHGANVTHSVVHIATSLNSNKIRNAIDRGDFGTIPLDVPKEPENSGIE